MNVARYRRLMSYQVRNAKGSFSAAGREEDMTTTETHAEPFVLYTQPG